MSGSGQGGKSGKGRGRRGLSDEDAALWEHTAQSVTQAQRLKSRVHPATEALAEADGQAPSRPALRHETRVVDHHRPLPVQKPQPIAAKPQPAAKTPPIADFDRKKARKIGAGHIDIDARIDLHGLRQSEAHAALRRFIVSAQARGCRWVLVITGKGAPGRGTGSASDLRDAEAAHRSWLGGHIGEGERGVLRRNVPRWLAEPELRACVVSYTAAAIRHGGDGALYVHLRNAVRGRQWD